MGDELTCKPGTKLVAGPALETDPDNEIAPFCIDEHEVTNAEYYGYPSAESESKFELVQKDCTTDAWVVVDDPRATAEELLSSPANVPVDGKNVCGIEIRRQRPSKTDDQDQKGPQKPVVMVSWSEARAYCQSKGGDLSNSDQWEKAARGPNGHPYATKSGEELRKNEACYDRDAPCDVMSFAPNGYGLYDMTGGVWEWVLGGWFFRNDIRGGAWRNLLPENLRADARVNLSLPDGRRDDDVGFRCVFDPQDSQG